MSLHKKCEAPLLLPHFVLPSQLLPSLTYLYCARIVTEVCLASGTTQYLRLSELVDTFDPKQEDEDYAPGNGTFFALYSFLDGIYCARSLFNSDDRKGDPRLANDEFPYEDENGFLRLPIGVDLSGDNRDAHGKLNAGDSQAGSFFSFITLDGTIGGGRKLNDPTQCE